MNRKILAALFAAILFLHSGWVVYTQNAKTPRPLRIEKVKGDLYMISGEVIYRHANLLYRMRAGDSLLFDADAPHGPEQLVRLPARYLSIICYRPNQVG